MATFTTQIYPIFAALSISEKTAAPEGVSVGFLELSKIYSIQNMYGLQNGN
jgi:hypothetical protein